MSDFFLKAKATIEKNEILGDILYIVLGFMMAYLFYAGLGFALGTENPVVTVVSGSMLPTLERGDALVLKSVTPEELVYGRMNGTIIVYYQPSMNKLIVHRLYKKNEDGTYKTWGDNNPFADPWSLTHDQIRGKVLLRIPYMGYPKLILSDFINLIR